MSDLDSRGSSNVKMSDLAGAWSEVFSQLPETDCPGPEETKGAGARTSTHLRGGRGTSAVYASINWDYCCCCRCCRLWFMGFTPLFELCTGLLSLHLRTFVVDETSAVYASINWDWGTEEVTKKQHHCSARKCLAYLYPIIPNNAKMKTRSSLRLKWKN